MANRRESVSISAIDDGFTTTVAKMTAATMAFDGALDRVDGHQDAAAKSTKKLRTETSGLAGDLDRAGGAADGAAAGIDKTNAATRRQSKEIDRLSGRLRLYTDLALGIGPGLVPIGALGVPAVATLAAGFGALALVAGSAVVAFQGVGDATKALDEYDLAPTAANLEAVDAAMAKLGPDAAAFVLAFQDFQPVLGDIKEAAARGWFPGLSESLANFERVGPQIASIFEEVGRAGGESVRDFSAELAGPRYAEFLGFLKTAAPAAVSSLGRMLSSTAHGVTQLMMTLNPGIQGGFGWIEDVAKGFDRWASSAEGAKSVEDILAYVRETGPEVAGLIGSLGSAIAALVRATAPLGGTVLVSLTALLDAFATLANSPLGTPLLAAAAAMTTITRASQLTNGALGLLSGSFDKAGAGAHRAETRMGKFGRAANIAGLALAGFSVASSLQNDFDGLDSGLDAVTRGLTDLSGATKGAGLPQEFDDLSSSFDRLTDPGKVLALQDTLENVGVLGVSLGDVLGRDDVGEKAKAQFESLDQALSGLVETAGSDQALASFDALVNKMGLSGSEVDGLLKMLPGYRDALTGAGSSADAAASSSERLAAAHRAEAAAVQQAAGALRDKMTATIAAFDAETAYREALKGAREQADDNNRGIDGMSDAALKNRSALSGLAQAWNNQSNAVKNNAGRYNEMRGQLISVAQGMGVTRERAVRLANSMLQIPQGVVKSLVADFKTLPKNVQTDIRANGIPKTKADVEALARKYDLTPKQVQTLMKLKDQASGRGKQILELLRQIAGTSAEPKVGLSINPFKRNKNTVDRGMDAMDGSSANPFVDLYDAPWQRGAGRVRGGMRNLDGTRANPRADLDDRVTGPANRAAGSITSIPRTWSSTIYINTIRNTQFTTTGKLPKNQYNAGQGGSSGADGGINDGRPYRAGGLHRFADGGGFGLSDGRRYKRESQIVPGGANILWAEPETRREAYISDKPSMRTRNMGILDEVAGWYGARLERYANGGTRLAPAQRRVLAAPQPIRAGAGAGGSTVVRERVIERMADRVVLDIGGQQFVATVRSVAGDVARREIDADREFDRNHMGG